MAKLNYNKAILKAKQVIILWQYRYLTPMGKITVLKTLALSKFNHLFMSVLTEDRFLDEVNSSFFKFIWNGKPDKVNRKDICRPYLEGGLNTIDIQMLEKSAKMFWIKKLLSSHAKP